MPPITALSTLRTGDGVLSAQDANFGKFRVMDTNAHDSQTAMTLTQLGITQINLKTDAAEAYI